MGVDNVEAWDSNQPRLQTTITKESRRHLQAQDHLVLHPPREGADTEAAVIAISPQTHTKNGIIGICTCYSCGFDVPKCHTNATCPWECRKNHHQEGYTREKYEEYVQTGWRPSKVGKHKKYLPIPRTELGE